MSASELPRLIPPPQPTYLELPSWCAVMAEVAKQRIPWRLDPYHLLIGKSVTVRHADALEKPEVLAARVLKQLERHEVKRGLDDSRRRALERWAEVSTHLLDYDPLDIAYRSG